MKSYQIRQAAIPDAEKLAAVETSASQRFRDIADLAWIADAEPTSLEDHIALIDAGTVWVAVDGKGDIFGFLLAERCGDELHICEFAVKRPRQGQGIGSSLVRAAEEYARTIGLAALTLTTFRGLSWNEPFYHHLGFATLEADALDDRLRTVFAREASIGLPMERRCAMRLTL